VHDHYLELEGYRETQSLSSTALHIPRFERPGAAIEAILARRIALTGRRDPADLFSSGALARFAEIYGIGLNRTNPKFPGRFGVR
jgi:hypothetical protein